MILCDTGPLVAVFDRGDQYHVACTRQLAALPPKSLMTTWPCLTEAMYFLGRAGGIREQDRLWEFIARGSLKLFPPTLKDEYRCRDLMRKYANFPMDVADASMVVVAEWTGFHTVFTLDSHFRSYLINDIDYFTVVP